MEVSVFRFPDALLVGKFSTDTPVLELAFMTDGKTVEARCTRSVLRYSIGSKNSATFTAESLGSELPKTVGPQFSGAETVAQLSADGSQMLVGEFLIRKGQPAVRLAQQRRDVVPNRTQMSPSADRILLHGTVTTAERSRNAVCLLVDAGHGKVLSEVASPSVVPGRLVFDASMKQLITQFREGFVVWGVEDVQRRFRLQPERVYGSALRMNDDEVRRVRFSSNSRFVYTAGSNTSLKVWDATSGMPLTDEPLGADSFIKPGGSMVSPDGQIAISFEGGRETRRWHAWDLTAGQSVDWLKNPRQQEDLRAMACSADSKFLALVFSRSGGPGYSVQVWDLTEKRLKHNLEVPFGAELNRGPPVVCFTPDASKLILNARGRILHVFDVQTGGMLHILQDETKGDPRLDPAHRIRYLMGEVLVSPDNRMLIAQYGTEYTLIWSLVDGRLLHRIDDDNGNIEANRRYQFSRDSTKIRCLYTRPFKLLDARTWKSTEIDDSAVDKLEGFGPRRWDGWRGRQVVLLPDTEIRELEAKLGIQLQSAERSEDGRRLCLYPGDQSFYIVDAESPELQWRYFVLEQGYSMVGIHRDGRRSGDADYLLSP
jgi:WD40 repeat protein